MQQAFKPSSQASNFLLRKGHAVLVSTALLAFPGAALPAGSAVVSVPVSATILSSSNCKFNVPKSTALAFGTIDPSGSTNITATGSLVVRCGGSAPNATFAIDDDSGLNETGVGAYRMRHTVTATAYLGYSVSYAPQSATIPKNTNQTITITGTITSAQYANAIAGNYSDTITVTVSP